MQLSDTDKILTLIVDVVWGQYILSTKKCRLGWNHDCLRIWDFILFCEFRRKLYKGQKQGIHELDML